MERRLAAILAADVVGYTRLMGADETGTLRRLNELRQQVLEPLIAEHHGRVVKLMGDGLLVEFASVVDALTCAVAWQKSVSEQETATEADNRLTFRIGINIGDVIIEGDDIFGDGVNVAARLEGLAQPGGICVARNVVNQVKGKINLAFEDLGEQTMKNVAEPIQVFQVRLDGTAPAAPELPTGTRKRLPAIGAGLALSLIVIVALAWWAPWEPRIEPASVEAMAFPLPDKPSIAVLPFNNMSEDASQEYFADGMTEDLITDLSKISGLFVIARNSSFSYKGQQVKVRQVAEELGVRYILEGSVRRAGNEVRINAQLIDATTGGHLWAERYDGTLEDIFALQDQVTEQIVAALAVSLTGKEKAAQARHATENAEAHDAYLRGWAHYKLGTPEDLARAVPFLEEAVRLDPGYAQGHAALASLYWDTYVNDWAFDLGMPSSRAESRASEHLEEALKSPTPLAHALQARMLASWGFYDDAVLEAEKAVALDENDATALAGIADALIKADRPAEALEPIERAMRLDPHHPTSYVITLGAAQLGMERFREAAETFERALKRNPSNELPFIYLASTLGYLGRIEEADEIIDQANDVRNLIGLGELSIRDTSGYSGVDFDAQIDFARFGSKPVQERLRAGLADIPSLKWQYLMTVHRPVRTYENSRYEYEVEGATLIDVATAKSFHDRGAVFIDVSGETAWRSAHVPGAVHLSWERTVIPRFSKTALREVADQDEEIVLYFDNGVGTTSASWEAAKAITWGYRKVHHFDGGAQAWAEAGYPIESGH